MTGDFAAAHDELRSVARDLLAKATAPAWAQLAGAGWLGLEVTEDLEGAGASFAEVAVVLEEMGRAATAGPYFGTAVLGVGTLNLLEPHPARDALLRLIALGERKVAVALPAETGSVDGISRPDEISRPQNGWFRLAEDGRLQGRAEHVIDAPDADRLLVPARTPDGDAVIVVVHSGAEAPPGLDVTPAPTLDATRRLGAVTADAVEVNSAGVWRFAGDPAASMARLLDRAALAIAVDALGPSAAMLDATVAYASARHQFGRPIGSFQAVKHACADMLVRLSMGRELVAAAIDAIVADDASGADDAGEADAGVAVAMAKSYVCSAAVDIVGKALQLHGGIGYTWEGGIHVHLKRAALDRSLFGSPRAHRRRLAGRHVLPS